MPGNIHLGNDIGAPLVVTVVNIASEASGKTIGKVPLDEVLTYAMTVFGYLAAGMNWGGSKYGTFLKNIGVASAPLTFQRIYERAKGTPMSAKARPMTRVSRYPAPAAESPFQGVRLV